MRLPNTVETGSNSQGQSPTLATVLSQINWGGTQYPTYEARCEDVAGGGGGAAAASSAAPAAGSGTPAAAAASPAAGQGGSDSSAGNANAGGGAGAGAGAGNPNDDNLRTLRTNYETLKPWEKVAAQVKDPTAALAAHTRVTTMFNDGLKLAKALGYTDESYKAAFEDDPVDTLSALRTEHAKANPDAANAANVRKIAEEAARNANKPITDEINRQKTETAMNRYDGEFNRLLTDDTIGFGKDVSEDVKEALYDIMDSLVPDTLLAEVKATGKVAGIQKVFEQAKTHLLKIVNSYNGMTAAQSKSLNAGNGGRVLNKGAAGGNGDGNAGHALTLDDIINDPTASLPGLKAGKY